MRRYWKERQAGLVEKAGTGEDINARTKCFGVLMDPMMSPVDCPGSVGP